MVLPARTPRIRIPRVSVQPMASVPLLEVPPAAGGPFPKGPPEIEEPVLEQVCSGTRAEAVPWDISGWQLVIQLQ